MGEKYANSGVARTDLRLTTERGGEEEGRGRDVLWKKKAWHVSGNEVGRVGSSQGLSGWPVLKCNDSFLLLFSFAMRPTYNGH
jgi:hypothetical protein